MDPADFEGMFKYKLFLPVLYLVNWALMLCGPIIFPVGYQRFTLVVFAYMLIKTIFNFAWCIVGFTKAMLYLDQSEKYQSEESNSADGYKIHLMDDGINDEIYHLFVIPSYCEQSELLSQTIDQLSTHPTAKQRYLLVLAMEAHEQGSQTKAGQLIESHSRQFRSVTFSYHKLRRLQQKGKASNVSWCVQNLQATVLQQLNIAIDQVMVTIIDADSLVPSLYIRQVDRLLSKSPQQRYNTIYQPSQIFTRNHLEVPLLTRTYDQSHSLVHFCNLVSCFNASFPLSNYSMSLALIKQVGFWDTCPDAIGEDFHMTIKSFWKTKGQVYTEYIHIAFNQLNVQTGLGYRSDLAARFWQAQRHARGCADAAYCLKMLLQTPISFRCLLISFQAIQCFVLPAIIPWALLGSTAQSIRYAWFEQEPKGMIPGQYVSYMFNLCTLLFLVSYFLYFWLKRRTTRQIYNMNNESFWRIIEFPLMILPNLFLVSFPTFTIAAFRVLLNSKHEYTVAQKKVAR